MLTLVNSVYSLCLPEQFWNFWDGNYHFMAWLMELVLEKFFSTGSRIWLAWQDSQVKFNQLEFFLWGHPSRHWAMFYCMQCQYPWRSWMCILKEWNLSFSYKYYLDPCQCCTANRRGTSKRMKWKNSRRTMFERLKYLNLGLCIDAKLENFAEMYWRKVGKLCRKNAS